MQYGLEKIILPSFYNQTPPEKLTRFVNWGIKTLIPILKESDVPAAKPFVQLVNRYQLDLPKILQFVNTYLEINRISSKQDLMALRNLNILSASNESILKDIVKGYVFDHPWDAMSVKSDHTDYRDAAISQIKSSYQANQIDDNNMFDKIFRGIIYWSIANYQTPEMLEAKRQAILLEERKKQQEEQKKKEQESLKQKEPQEQQSQVQETTDRKGSMISDLNWGVVLDVIKNKDKQAKDPNQQIDAPKPIDVDQSSSSILDAGINKPLVKSKINVIGKGATVLITTAIAFYGLTKLMSKHRN